MNDLTTVPQSKAGGMTEVASSRQAQEVQAAVIMARRFPRDTTASLTRILEDCKRVGLAERAVYEYARGGTKVTGPSIRLAESIARSWGNMDCGVTELERKPAIGNLPGESTVQAFAWDLETNTRITKVFTVRHWRDTKQGGYALKDERDLYELVANNGARRLRACILGIIPVDIVEQAIEQCEKTMRGGQGPLIDRVRQMVVFFKEQFGVSQEMIEKRLQHKVEAITENELVSLKKIANSIKDGMADRAEYFELNSDVQETKSEAKQEVKTIKNYAPQPPPKEVAIQEKVDEILSEVAEAPSREELSKEIAKEQRRLKWKPQELVGFVNVNFKKKPNELTDEEMNFLVTLLSAIEGAA